MAARPARLSEPSPSRPEIQPIEMTGTMGRKSSSIRIGTLPAESEFIQRNSLKNSNANGAVDHFKSSLAVF
jgi:hypothetical protein